MSADALGASFVHVVLPVVLDRINHVLRKKDREDHVENLKLVDSMP